MLSRATKEKKFLIEPDIDCQQMHSKDSKWLVYYTPHCWHNTKHPQGEHRPLLTSFFRSYTCRSECESIFKWLNICIIYLYSIVYKILAVCTAKTSKVVLVFWTVQLTANKVVTYRNRAYPWFRTGFNSSSFFVCVLMIMWFSYIHICWHVASSTTNKRTLI